MIGILGQFANPRDLVEAARQMHASGYRQIDSYSPFEVEEINAYLPRSRSLVSESCLAGGLIGGLAGFGLQYWVNVWAYPLDVGGQAHNSWPAFIPITFECAVLGAALCTLAMLLWQARLLQPYHKVFTTELGSEVSKGAFVLYIDARDPAFEGDKTARELSSLKALRIEEVLP